MGHAGPIVGREREIGELTAFVAAAEGRALVLRGEPGVGKSALLDVAAERAADLGQRVVRAAGVEAEAGLAFAGLHQLLHPLLADAGALEPATRAAFDIVFGRSTGEPPSVMTLGVAVLDLLALASGDVPLLLVADDAHWLDPQSAEVARFIARRLSGHAVHMAVGTRADTPSPWDGAGLPELTVPPLSAEASARLLDTTSPGLTAPVRRRILDEACGNPLDAPPVLIGHSFGGLIAQKLLGKGLARAAVAVDPAQIKGVRALPPAQLRAGFPVLGNPANRKRSVSLTPAQFRFGFGNALEPAESDALHERFTIPSPGRPLFEAAFAAFTRHSPAEVATRNPDRGPLLLISGQADHTVPDVVTRAAYKLYGDSPAVTELKQFPDRGHSLTVDHGWRAVAEYALDWLDRQGIQGHDTAHA